jgi:SpoVK/Ycf46/Vps4 family AAA+-type ATPase
MVAGALAGSTLAAAEKLLKTKHHADDELTASDLAEVKKQIVEADCRGLVEFVESKKTLDAISGGDAIKAWLRQDIALWEKGDTAALPKGYLLCGPVGTGKSFTVECLAGEAGVPVVKFGNFRDKWVGSTEGNLERIFRLLRALGRCYVFIDEADQSLGKRESGGDSGVSGRVYSMIAEEMGSSESRGRIIWVLASSRPDLIEVDLKRPGRVDIKIPLLPTADAREGFQLVRFLCRSRGLEIGEDRFAELAPKIPVLLTPGAAETIAVKTYRLMRTKAIDSAAALAECLDQYRPPVSLETIEFQMRLAIAEASDPSFVPPPFAGLLGKS